MDSFNDAYTKQPSFGSSEEYYRPMDNTEFEANYVQVTATASRGRHSPFSLTWEKLPEAQYQSIKTFFDSHVGEEFTWTHPVTSVVHTVMFRTGKLKTDFVTPFGHRKLSLELEEM
ncbi:MAG: hypothetical protein A4E60_00224 [Syntrophorhabdus sp. PtaB.Bin047]|jgi:hypothetical protein|nr:MAG: hypothetical protein A4E60_00224 [Syntrophorhabdus sp. PtaB.Bin047]